MWAFYVVGQRFSLLFKGSSFDVAYKAEILFILCEGVIIFSERSKRVKHDTWDDVAKQDLKENEVYHVIAVSNDFESLHALTDSPWNK